MRRWSIQVCSVSTFASSSSNVVGRQVEVYAEPGVSGYHMRVEYPVGHHVPVVLNGVETGSVAVDDILP
jgi:hypothetical protein